MVTKKTSITILNVAQGFFCLCLKLFVVAVDDVDVVVVFEVAEVDN